MHKELLLLLNPQRVDITGGTFKVTSDDEQSSYSGNIHSGRFANNSEGGTVGMYGT
jgi:hypothetical protein